MAERVKGIPGRRGQPCEIVLFFHCAECLKEKPKNVSPKEWSRIQAGWTKRGLQVWCNRHDMNVVNLDFMGQKVKPL